MLPFIQLTNTEGREVWLNPARIDYVADPSSGGALVVFGAGAHLYVRETPEQIGRAVEMAIARRADLTGGRL